MAKKFEFKAEGRLFDIQLLKSFLTKNGFDVKKENFDDTPFFACVYFNKDGFDILHKQDWFLRTNLDVYRLINTPPQVQEWHY